MVGPTGSSFTCLPSTLKSRSCQGSQGGRWKRAVQIFILNSSDIIQLLPSPKHSREQGVAVSALCCVGGALASRLLGHLAPSGRRHHLPTPVAPTLHLFLPQQLFSDVLGSSARDGSQELQTARGWRGEGRRGDQRSGGGGLSMKHSHRSSLPGPFPVTCDVERTIHLSLPSVFLGDFKVQERVFVKEPFSYVTVQCPDLPTPPRWGTALVMCPHGPLQ